MKKQVTIDAAGKKVGRLATEIASILNGKTTPDYAPNKVADVEVTVENVEQMDIPQKKMDNLTHQRYSGYPGGLKITKWKEVVDKKGYGELLKVAVKGMLPKNRLQSKRLKNLNIK